MVLVAIVSQGAPGNEGRDIPALHKTMLVEGSVSLATLLDVAVEHFSPVLTIEISKPLSNEKLRPPKSEAIADGVHL